MEAIIIFQDGLTSIQFFLHKADRDYRASMKATRDNSTMRVRVRQDEFLDRISRLLNIPANADQTGGCIG
jgi:hypothetical protein